MLDQQATLLERLDLIPGWLAAPAALFTIHILRAQRRRGIRGPALEIGVYKGKYLALMRATLSDRIVGVELCPGGHAEDAVTEIINHVRAAAGHADDLRIVVENSRDLSAEELLDMLGAAPAFIHVDGGHDIDTVFHDLEMCAAIIRPGGVIALDDAFNFTTPGVTEAITRFLAMSTRLAPFAHCYNKLFVTTPNHHATYLADAHAFLDAAPPDVTERTKKRLAENDSVGFVPLFHGREILPFL